MNTLTKLTGVGMGAVLAVGLMGMSQASGDHSPIGGSHHENGMLGSANVGASNALSSRAKRSLPRLRGKVDSARNITISSDPVSSGRYRLIVRDSTTSHNWHILGNGVDRETTVPGTGRWAWRVRLRDGKYTVQCDAHAASMRFTLNVT